MRIRMFPRNAVLARGIFSPAIAMRPAVLSENIVKKTVKFSPSVKLAILRAEVQVV